MTKYDSYEFRESKKKYSTKIENELMEILMEFGETVDPQGYDGGDYDTSMTKLLAIIEAAQQSAPRTCANCDHAKVCVKNEPGCGLWRQTSC